MEAKLRAVLEGGRPGVSVTRLCLELGISRDSYYRYLHRWEEKGPAGLVAQSRRPHRSPHLLDVELEEEIVRLRKELPLDNGAQTIAYHLARTGRPVPSVRTIHRALVRRGLVVPAPRKRPKSVPWRRFEFPAPNAAWQIDATRWALADGSETWVMDVLDDHSRVVVAARAVTGPTGAAAWEALTFGATTWGLPARVMSDNGSCFTGRFLSQTENDFERTLRAAGVTHLLSSPAHPQTCGKLERFHQTLKLWLRKRPLAADNEQLQDQLDEFLRFYNHHRPHRALHGATPAERWAASPPEIPGPPLLATPEVGLQLVDTNGTLRWRQGRTIQVGTEHAGTRLLVIARDLDITILSATGEVRRLTIDPTRRYQPSEHPRRGGPRRRP